MRLLGDASASIENPGMRRAFRLAECGDGGTSPNPSVGCVLRRDGGICGEGYDGQAGVPRAVAVVPDHRGPRARGAVACVALEPGNHFGRTPRCVPRLIGAALSGLVVGMRDPNPNVHGGGIEALGRGGEEADLADDPALLREQNEARLEWVEKRRPRLRLKAADTTNVRPEGKVRAMEVGLAGGDAAGIRRTARS